MKTGEILPSENTFTYGDHKAGKRVSDVDILILAVELLDGSGDMLLEGTLMSTALNVFCKI